MILHADLDAFYANVAQRDDPVLRGKPLAVAGSSRRAVVLTASYEARPFGIRSAMPLFLARERCPQLVVVPPDFDKYRAASRAVFAIYRSRARAVEPLSLDEAFLDLPDVSPDEAAASARAIKAAVRAATELTVSVGIATGKMTAKIASDDGKPDGLVAVPPGSEAEYLASKPVGRLWGIGPKTERRLRARGIERIGQVAKLSEAFLYELFGKWGLELRDLSRGIDPRPVVEDDTVRSISSEETFERDVDDFEVLARAVRAHSEELADRLHERQLCAFTVAIKIKLANFTVVGRQTSLALPTDDAAAIHRAAVFCLSRAGLSGKRVRLVGTRVASLVHSAAKQLELFG